MFTFFSIHDFQVQRSRRLDSIAAIEGRLAPETKQAKEDIQNAVSDNIQTDEELRARYRDL